MERTTRSGTRSRLILVMWDIKRRRSLEEQYGCIVRGQRILMEHFLIMSSICCVLPEFVMPYSNQQQQIRYTARLAEASLHAIITT